MRRPFALALAVCLAACGGELTVGASAPDDADVDAAGGTIAPDGDSAAADAPQPLRPPTDARAIPPGTDATDAAFFGKPDFGAVQPDADAVPPPPPADAAVQPPPAPDAAPPAPDLPVCECFVRSAWCGAGAAAAGLARDTPCRVPLVPGHEDDVLGCDANGHWIVQQACEFGCFAAPPGTADSCNPDPSVSPDNPGWAPCPHHALLKSGLHPEASDRLRCIGITADGISQTIGHAAASAGYHEVDGQANGHDYCAAVDIRIMGRNNAQLRTLLQQLGENGFAAWYRWPGHDGWPAADAPHIHAVFVGVPMKVQLREQVRDFLVGKNGLTSHTHYTFWEAPQAILDLIRLLFSRHYQP